jgi:hypothetical protein
MCTLSSVSAQSSHSKGAFRAPVVAISQHCLARNPADYKQFAAAAMVFGKLLHSRDQLFAHHAVMPLQSLL